MGNPRMAINCSQSGLGRSFPVPAWRRRRWQTSPARRRALPEVSVRSMDPDEAREVGSRVYHRHRVTVLGDARRFAMTLEAATLGPLTIGWLTYDTEVRLESTHPGALPGEHPDRRARSQAGGRRPGGRGRSRPRGGLFPGPARPVQRLDHARPDAGAADRAARARHELEQLLDRPVRGAHPTSTWAWTSRPAAARSGGARPVAGQGPRERRRADPPAAGGRAVRPQRHDRTAAGRPAPTTGRNWRRPVAAAGAPRSAPPKRSSKPTPTSRSRSSTSHARPASVYGACSRDSSAPWTCRRRSICARSGSATCTSNCAQPTRPRRPSARWPPDGDSGTRADSLRSTGDAMGAADRHAAAAPLSRILDTATGSRRPRRSDCDPGG